MTGIRFKSHDRLTWKKQYRLKQADIEKNQTYSKREPNGQKRLPKNVLLKIIQNNFLV